MKRIAIGFWMAGVACMGLLGFSSPAAAGIVKNTGKIKNVRIIAHPQTSYTESGGYGQYSMMLTMEPAFTGTPICGGNYAAIGSENPLFDAMVALALTAKTNQYEVQVVVYDTCSYRDNSLAIKQIEITE